MRAALLLLVVAAPAAVPARVPAQTALAGRQAHGGSSPEPTRSRWPGARRPATSPEARPCGS